MMSGPVYDIRDIIYSISFHIFENDFQDKYSFYFVSEEPYRTMQQLADLACRKLMDGDQVSNIENLQ